MRTLKFSNIFIIGTYTYYLDIINNDFDTIHYYGIGGSLKRKDMISNLAY